MIHVIDYKIGNIGSVINMLHHLGADVSIATTPKDIKSADKIILPGVGAFDAGVAALNHSGFGEAIKEAVSRQTYVLGICLGMQLLMEFSEEGDSPGLGLVAGHVKKFTKEQASLPVPHMGWNTVELIKPSTLFQAGQNLVNRFYFVHSYYALCKHEEDRVGLTSYGSKFTSVFERQRVMGVQFHPEKSHRYGKELFKHFMAV